MFVDSSLNHAYVCLVTVFVDEDRTRVVVATFIKFFHVDKWFLALISVN